MIRSTIQRSTTMQDSVFKKENILQTSEYTAAVQDKFECNYRLHATEQQKGKMQQLLTEKLAVFNL